jgi:predicted ribosomally synthesized peptide with SipW-like signal peptide
MSERNIQISRRAVLAGLGTIGVASAGAGLGTTAYFNDTESFEGNTLTAGELDLKVDWEEHYSFPQIYGFDDPATGLDVTRTEPADTSGYTALPDPANPMVWVADEDLDAYMDNTSIEAYPDPDDDGQQDPFGEGDVADACTDGADLDDDLDSTEGLRTENADTVLDDGSPAPLVNLSDVKPGDFGELTLSLHLCTNPGYIWMQGGLVEAAEGGIPESESDSSDSGPADEVVTELGTGDSVELLDEIETVAWYDGDCDNVLSAGTEGEEGEEADVVIVMDRSGSMGGNDLVQAQVGARALVDALGPNDRVGLVSFSDGTGNNTNASVLDQGLTSDHTVVKTAINGLNAGGNTNMEAAVERAHEELTVTDTFGAYGESGNARLGARKIMVFLGDGQPNEGTNVTDSDNESPVQEATNAKNDDIEIFTIAYGGGAPPLLADMATDPNNGPESQYAFSASVSDIVTVFEQIGGTVSTGGEEVFHRGTLRELLEKLETDNGIPLDGDQFAEGRSCFAGMQTHCVGLAWWLPTTVENQVQTDSVSFDLGFYAEQCRHNDGSGPEIAE